MWLLLPRSDGDTLHNDASLANKARSLQCPAYDSSSPVESRKLSIPTLLPTAFRNVSLPTTYVSDFRSRALGSPVPQPSFYHIRVVSLFLPLSRGVLQHPRESSTSRLLAK